MSDLALVWDSDALAADLVAEANDLVRDAGLETAILLSLYTDRRAEDGDVLPLGETDRRGWWGDAVPVVEGDRMGSRLWLLAREKQTDTVRRRAEEYVREALQWLVDDRVASRIEVAVSFPRSGAIGITVDIYRPGADSAAAYRFDHVWPALET